MSHHVRNSWPPVNENLADAIFGSSGTSSHGHGATVGWSVGGGDGSPVGIDVRQTPLDTSHTFDVQSALLEQPLPTSQAGHLGRQKYKHRTSSGGAVVLRHARARTHPAA